MWEITLGSCVEIDLWEASNSQMLMILFKIQKNQSEIKMIKAGN